MHYLAHDRVTGKIFRISNEIAQAVSYCKNLLQTPRNDPDREQLKTAFGFLNSLQSMQKLELSRRAAFNPLFINVSLFSVGPLQPYLVGLSRFWVGPIYGFCLAVLSLVALFLGSWSGWEILGVFKNVFSLNAIATFAIVAPFLKILHELGHTLAATRYGVAVRKAGLYLIGLYPMPFVDCTDADLTATRNQRIVISLAGLFTDILVAMIAFVAWHFVEGSFLKTLLGNIFMFSSLNSVLFNANPLIKLDGYYALADTIRTRNLYTDATQVFRNLRRKIMTFGRDGRFPSSKRSIAMSLYAIGSVLYKTNMILGILWIMLPKYFGLGVVMAIWGGYVMFFSPLLRADNSRKKPKASTKLFWFLFVGCLVAVLIFIKLPYRTMFAVAPDISNQYSLQTQASGILNRIEPEGMVEAGQVLMELKNPELEDLLILITQQMEVEEYRLNAVRGTDPAGAIIAAEKLDSTKVQLELTRQSVDGLIIRAAEYGYFAPDVNLLPGDMVLDGENFGVLFPQAATTMLAGNFPERYVQKFQATTPRPELRVNGAYLPADLVLDLRLVQTVVYDQETGTRTYLLNMPVSIDPVDISDSDIYVRLVFPSEPLYKHVLFFIDTLNQKFRDAKLAQN